MSNGYGNKFLWVLQVLLAAVFIHSGIGKLIGDENTVQTFSEIGIGQWFRYVVGVLEVGGGIGLLVPRLPGLAATGLAGVMIGAVLTEVVIIDGGDPLTPLILLVLAATVAWFRRDRTIVVIRRWSSPSGNRTEL